MDDHTLSRSLDRNALGLLEDWQGNNIAFACPICLKVFIVSGMLHRDGRECPNCGKSKAFITPDDKTASVECSGSIPIWKSE